MDMGTLIALTYLLTYLQTIRVHAVTKNFDTFVTKRI